MSNATAGTVEVDVKGDFSKFERDLKGKGSTAGGTFGSSFGSSMGSKIATAGAALFGAQFAKGAIEGASDLEESVNVTGLAFGEARGEMDKFAGDSAEKFGLAESEFRQMSATMGNVLRGMGATAGQASDDVLDLTERATDMGSAWNASTEEVMAAMQSGFVGSFEPLRKYGVILDATKVKNKALEEGLIDEGEALDDNAKRIAITKLMLEQTNNVAGDFANTSAGVANSSKIVSAQWKDMQAQLGTALLPLLSSVLQVLRALGPDGMKMALMIGAGILVFTKLAQAAMAFSGALNVLAANPWVLAALAIIAVGVLIWKNWDTIVEKLGAAWEWIKSAASSVADFFAEWWPLMLAIATGGIGLIVYALVSHWDTIKAGFSAAWQWIGDTVGGAIGTIAGTITGTLNTVLGSVNTVLDTMRTTFATVWNGAVSIVTGAIDSIIGAVDRLKSAIASVPSLPDIGGGIGSAIGRIPGFDAGGVVPGPIGSPQLILAHGGETVLPTHKSTSPAVDLAAGPAAAATLTVAGPLMVVDGNSFADPDQLERHGTELVRIVQRELDRERRGAGRARGGVTNT